MRSLAKTFRAEGIAGWYKGSTAHLLRIAPHTVLTLVLNEKFVQFYAAAKHSRLAAKTASSESA